VASFTVSTADGGELAVFTSGNGPPIVLVHGSMSEHVTFDALVGELAPSFSTFAMDRRGFGASPEFGVYSADREFDDVAAVVDAVAARAGEPVLLVGHSWGATCAMGGATRTRNLNGLVLYEPSFGLKYPAGFIELVDAQVRAGDAEGAIVSVLTTLAGMTDEQVEAMRSAPTWPARLKTAPTIAREARIEDEWVLAKGQFDAIKVPTLFISATDSPPELVKVTHKCAEVIPGSRIHELAGRDHFAHRSHPKEIAAIIRDFAA
jgi:pimeloyl-ACP methyl ester carboxylesterase